jgi:hypothetical protein
MTLRVEVVARRPASLLRSLRCLNLSAIDAAVAPQLPPYLSATDLRDEYLRFLALAAASPGQRIVPSELVDLYWHTHLYLGSYASDCEAALGGVIGHDGGFGIDDRGALEEAAASTLSLYLRVFGSPSPLVWGVAAAAACSSCVDNSRRRKRSAGSVIRPLPVRR